MRAPGHTTPEADETARAMAGMREAGATYVAMEVSSHALELGRVRAVRFRVAAFTNLTQDHLDFHGSMDRYGDAKARLFTELGPGAVVLNVGDAFGRELATRVRAPLVRVSGVPGAEADVVPVVSRVDARGIEATVRTPRGDVDLRSRLIGAHNLENLVVALGIAQALDLDLGSSGGCPLRLEQGVPGDGSSAATPPATTCWRYVDYAPHAGRTGARARRRPRRGGERTHLVRVRMWRGSRPDQARADAGRGCGRAVPMSPW